MNTPSISRSASALTSDAVDVGNALSLSIDESWLQGRSVYGGMQLALALKAMRRVVGSDIPIRSLQATFLAPVLASEPVIADATLLRAGRSVTHVQAQLRQGDHACLECTAILGVGRDTELKFAAPDATEASPEQALKFRYKPGVIPNFIQHYDLRWARGTPPFTGTTDPAATIFARPLAEDVRYDESEFLTITDVIPPPVISLMRTPAPASTMNCTIELIRPEAIYGTRLWVRFEVTLHDAHSGYAWQTARIYSESGTLLAVAHQSVAVFG
jgi:acyl-CoA thioesterase